MGSASEDIAEIVQVLTAVAERDPDPLFVKLARSPGRKGSDMHLSSVPIDIKAHASRARRQPARSAPALSKVAELQDRVSQIEA